ncbi:MAG: hypothetical protein OIF57_00025 [Marinobacterium sp.]|nr:hypothetical protein [Marinobacterium sp.]
MFEFLKGREQKLIDAIESGDMEQLTSLLNRPDNEALNSPLKTCASAAEFAISCDQPTALALILQKGGDANQPTSTGEPLTTLALRRSDSLNMLTTLLANGADIAATDAQGATLLQQCATYCSSIQLPLHLSRLQQQGVDLNSEPALLLRALTAFDQPLIQFLINSGCTLPATLPAEVPAQATQYAQRLISDYQIRQQLLQR